MRLPLVQAWWTLVALLKLSRFSLKRPGNSSILGGTFAGINRLKETLVDDGKLSRADFDCFVSIRSSFVSYCCEDNFVMEHYCHDQFSR